MGSLPQRMSIAVIVCSTRKPRVCPQVAAFVLKTIKSAPSSGAATFKVIDLSDWSLPIFDEPGIPQMITSPSGYAHEHTQRWSAEISQHDAFIFVTPQYNWSFPAAIKNAIDYLFNEWAAKPGMIVSYGGHGGGKAAVQLRQVLEGVRMRPVETLPGLSFGGREEVKKAAIGSELDLGKWDNERGNVLKAFEEMLVLLGCP